jgi:hypothetical protein
VNLAVDAVHCRHVERFQASRQQIGIGFDNWCQIHDSSGR